MIPWSQFLAGFVLASTLGILSLIPGGLGVFDTALVVLPSLFAPGPEQLVSGVLAYLTFGSGVVLLASAAFPTLTDRFVILHRYLPHEDRFVHSALRLNRGD